MNSKRHLGVRENSRPSIGQRNLAEIVLDFLPTYWKHRNVFPRALINYLRKQPFSASFDITNKCNARCPYCYFYSQEVETQENLTDEEMLTFIRSVKQQIPIVHATFIGGEPTLRPNVLSKAVKYFPHSWIITNGIKGFHSAKPSCWVWSVDGPKDIHNSIKGLTRSGKIRDVWTRSIERLDYATAPVITNTNMNRITAPHIKEFVAEMSKTSVRGMVLSFYTKIQGQDDELQLSDHQRKKVLNQIRELKKEYGDFILTTNAMGHFFTPGSGLECWNKIEKCPVARYSRAYTSDGKEYTKCAMGDSSVCDRCGCGMAPMFKSLEHLDLPTFKWVLSVL
ncbi:MAG: radical SAM protein [Candidatus Hodarchaeales archaeon]